MNPTTILWIYIVFLVLGGLMGFIKAKSKASLIASLAFGAALSLCALGIINYRYAADIILVFLVVFFGMRFAKSKKMMPGGMMTIATVIALALRNIRF